MPGVPPIIHTVANAEDVAAMQDDVRAAKKQADVVVVSWHWGVSPTGGGTGELVEYQVAMGHAAIDAGADLVVGHHPHLVQPIEVYKGKVIFYSIANLVHDLSPQHRNRPTILARCRIRDGQIREVAFVPGWISAENQPRYVKPAELPDVVKQVEQVSSRFGSQFEVRDEEVAVRT
jgi:poly-gamma-glutamate synthesis protein (capsule biosynthesis protein)